MENKLNKDKSDPLLRRQIIRDLCLAIALIVPISLFVANLYSYVALNKFFPLVVKGYGLDLFSWDIYQKLIINRRWDICLCLLIIVVLIMLIGLIHSKYLLRFSKAKIYPLIGINIMVICIFGFLAWDNGFGLNSYLLTLSMFIYYIVWLLLIYFTIKTTKKLIANQKVN